MMPRVRVLPIPIKRLGPLATAATLLATGSTLVEASVRGRRDEDGVVRRYQKETYLISECYP